MALGRSASTDQLNPGLQPRGPFSKTSVPEQSPELRRDYQSDRRAAIEAQIVAYEAEGKDTSHLRKILGRKGAKVSGHDVASTVEQPMQPGDNPPGVVVSADGVTVPEPEDGSAPDKRDQNQTPRDDPSASPVDPGPEAGKRKADQLPAQPQVATTPPAATPVVQEPRRDSAPAEKAAPRKAPAKRATAKRTPRARTR